MAVPLVKKEGDKGKTPERRTMTTQYEDFRHPNALTEVNTVPVFEGRFSDQSGFEETLRTGNRGCAYYFAKFDDTILRPIFVYKYNEKKYKPEIPFEALLDETEA